MHVRIERRNSVDRLTDEEGFEVGVRSKAQVCWRAQMKSNKSCKFDSESNGEKRSSVS
jgi:hypothetical protein